MPTDQPRRSFLPVLGPVLRGLAALSPTMATRHEMMAREFFARGQYEEAVRRYEWVLALKPRLPSALLGLAAVLVEQGKPYRARPLLRTVLAQQPKNQEARYLLAEIETCQVPPEWLPATTPPAILRRRMARQAVGYDNLRLGLDGVRVHAEIASRAVACLPGPGRASRILDLGCGTGLVGEVLWALEPHLEGVDVSSDMLAIARRRRRIMSTELARREGMQVLVDSVETDHDAVLAARGEQRVPPIYDALWKEDLRDYLLRQHLPSAHLILASDVFPILGGLTPVFDGVVRALHPGGWFIFSTDPGPQEGYGPYGSPVRFAHSEAYLDQQAARVGLVLVAHDMAPYDATRSGRYSLYRKPA